MTGVAVSFRAVSKSWGATRVLEDVSLDVEPGEFVVFLGESGSGKTTLLRMVNRLTAPDSGTVRVGGADAADQDPTVLRRGVGYVIQGVGLLPHLTALENAALVPRLLGWDPERRRDAGARMLRLTGLDPDEHGPRRPSELSGGQRQRVGVARALAADPPLLLMDEPFGAVDPITRRRLQADFRALATRLGKTVLFITHDVPEAFRLADRVAVLGDGRLRQAAPPDEIRRAPADALVRDLVSPDDGRAPAETG